MGNPDKDGARASQISTSPSQATEANGGQRMADPMTESIMQPVEQPTEHTPGRPAAVKTDRLPTATPIGLTVSQTLALPALAGARIVAGQAGHDRVVERVNVMEVPDILPWVKPKELLLTTGYPLRHSPSPLTDLIADLDRAGLSAIAIKPHRYLGDLPPELLAAADALGFPVIELPEGVAFDDILTDVLSDILDRQSAVLARADHVHRTLAQIALEGGAWPSSPPSWRTSSAARCWSPRPTAASSPSPAPRPCATCPASTPPPAARRTPPTTACAPRPSSPA